MVRTKKKKKKHDIWKFNQLTWFILIGKEVESIIQSGKFVPDDKIIHLIKDELTERNWLNSQSSWLLDGFPRTFPQAQALDKDLQEHDAMLNLVVELDVPEEVILERIENRFVVS